MSITIQQARDAIRRDMDALRERDITQIRASTITGGPACSRCGHNTVHGQRAAGEWYCRDSETCESRKVVAHLRAELAAKGWTAESPAALSDEAEQIAREERWS